MAIIAFIVAAALGVTTGSSGLPRAAAIADKAELRRLRSENNRAMVAHDLARTMQIAAEDYVLIGGNDRIHRSKADMQETWSHAFADPRALPCARQPTGVEVGEYDGIRRALRPVLGNVPFERSVGSRIYTVATSLIGQSEAEAGRWFPTYM